MTPEGKVVAAIKREAKALGGDTRKVEWSGRRGAPDLLVLLPGMHFFIEAKAPGGEASSRAVAGTRPTSKSGYRRVRTG